MAEIILTESQLKLIQEITLIEKKWSNFSDEEKNFVVEFLKVIYPEKASFINEAKWYNTVGDILGIVDPTGLVDLVNGISYIKQGDYFFGFLSMIAVLPILGDAIAKPIMGVGKGSKLMKGMSEALRLAKDGKTLEAGIVLEKSGKQSKLISKLIETSVRWGEKLKGAITKVPIPKGFKKVITEWIDLFIKAAKKGTQAKKVASSYKFASKVALSTPKEAEALIKNMRSVIKNNTSVFKNFKPRDPSFMTKYFWPGVSFGIYRNRALSSLARRTKFYAGFLDFLGITSFRSPDELLSSVPENELNKKFQDYVKTPESQKNWADDISQMGPEAPQQQTTQSTTQSSSGGGGFDPVSAIFSGLF